VQGLDVAVVIVTVNAESDIARNLAELRAQEGVELDVVVVDNGSVDRTVDVVAGKPDVRLIANGENRWLAPAWNQGLAATAADYVLFLTPDTSLPDGRVVRTLAEALEARPDAGLAGPRLLAEDGSDRRNGAYAFPTVRYQIAAALGLVGLRGRNGAEAAPEAPADAVRDVALVNGACMLARRAALDDVGGLDERYRLYWEEIDLARRLRDRGWTVLLVPHATAVHRGKGSPAPSELRRRAYRHGEHVYMRTHHGNAAAAVVSAARWLERLRQRLRRPGRTR
jgi:N-acetylglucosaminyl-diphospho-decaprenol L-rhamnosyltransferase